MKKKFFSILLTLVLALSLCLVTAVPVAAATTIDVVPGDDAIQTAIDAAGPDTIISVAAGIYEEDLVIPDTKTNLELVGATGATIKGVATEPDASFPAGIPNIEILASGVKIHGFTIQSPDAVSGQYASGMLIGAPNVEIYDNAFLTHTQGTGQYSVVIQTYRTGILAGVNISGLNIHDNTFDDIGDGLVGYDAIFVNLDEGAGLVTIAGNVFAGSLFRAISVERSNVVISGNSIITDLAPGPGYQGIYIGCWPLDGDPGPVQLNVVITGNTVKGSGEGLGFNQGIRVGHTDQLGLSGIVVSQNTVEGNNEGIAVKAPEVATPVDVVINNNSIVGNTLGAKIYGGTLAVLNATSNWWGTTDEDEIAAMVSGDVDFTNFLTQAPSWVEMTGDGEVPVVTTSTATNVGLWEATLQGELTDLGGATPMVCFQWGSESGVYTDSTVEEGPVATVPFPFSADLTDLTHNTTYYFRAKATVGELDVYGSEESFTTLTEKIGISVLPTSISFGTMTIGQPSGTETVTVYNDGDVAVDLTAEITAESVAGVYTTGLTIADLSVSVWGVAAPVTVAVGNDTGLLPLILTVPLATEPGTYTATLVFWAEAYVAP